MGGRCRKDRGAKSCRGTQPAFDPQRTGVTNGVLNDHFLWRTGRAQSSSSETFSNTGARGMTISVTSERLDSKRSARATLSVDFQGSGSSRPPFVLRWFG